MKVRAYMIGAVFAIALAACGGGGSGGGGVSVSTPATAAPSVSGDMLGWVSGRGWNYQTSGTSTAATITLYADPTVAPSPNATPSSVRVLLGAGVTGSVATVMTSGANYNANLLGGLGFAFSGNAYNVGSELSAGGIGAVPGSPLFVPGTLTLGQTWSPAPGATVTVVAVGQVPNASVCPSPSTGASVRYQYPGYDDTISFVPGCGITDMKNNTSSAEFSLVSVADYSAIGSLDIARRIATASYLDTALMLLGLDHRSSPAAAAVLTNVLKQP